MLFHSSNFPIQLVTENSELRREKPKLKKHIELLMGRIKDLENDLCRTKELANEEKRRYQRESDRINEAVRQRNLMVNGHAQIGMYKLSLNPSPNFWTTKLN